jgi:uncharacterized damage-inducible protein DinB
MAGRELGRIDEQLRRMVEGDAWHGPAVLELLEGVTPEGAHARPILGAHSIWEIVLHLASNYRVVLRRLGGEAATLAPEEDWPAVSAPTVEGWRAAIDALRAVNAEMRRAVRGFDEERLDRPLVPASPYSAYVQFIGLTQHDGYHAGQIALLKRALAKRGRGSDTSP